MADGTPSHEHTVGLILRAQAGDDAAQEQLVVENVALVKSIVRKFLSRAAEYEDLYQIGCMGLVKAIRKFDLSFDVRFSTYAVPMIAGEIKRFLRDDGMIKVSRSVKELAARAMRASAELAAELNREPGVGEIAQRLGETPEDVAMALSAARPHSSLYEPAYGEDSDVLVLDKQMQNGDDTNTVLDRVLLKELLSTLDGRERTIILLRYFGDKTQGEIAGQLGISQVQVSRLESRILRKLRTFASPTG